MRTTRRRSLRRFPMSLNSPSGASRIAAPPLVAFVVVAPLIVALSMSPARAYCAGVDSQRVAHSFGGWIASCPDVSPVTAFIFKLSSPSTVNSGNQSDLIVCESPGDTRSFPWEGGCQSQVQSGTADDGRVTV